MKNKLKIISKITAILSFFVLSPGTTFAQITLNTGNSVTCTSTGISRIICQSQQILNSIVPVLIALGVVWFVWGVVAYMINDEEEAKTKGRDKIISGIIGLAVVFSMWGLVNVLVNTFGLGGSVAPKLDNLAVSSGSACNFIGNSNAKFQDLLCYVTGIINNSIIPFIFALATVVFIWGAVNFFIINSDEEAKREQGKQFMIWGIVALAVMLCIWGLVNILGSTFGLRTSVLPTVQPPK